MILTAYAELETTIAAVNKGHIFRFLSKPCDSEDLAAAFDSALRQYQLVEAEKELVEGTLRGSVKVLSDVLSLVSPLAFGQTTRVKQTVDAILQRIDVDNRWQIEIAAMLASMGCVTVPSEILEKTLSNKPLDKEERSVFSAHPKIAAELVNVIPRLELVAEIIRNQFVASPPDSDQLGSLSKESKILQIALDFDFHLLTSDSSMHALQKLKANAEAYGQELYEALADYVKNESNFEKAEILPAMAEEGMILAQDIKNESGMLLMAKGQVITKSASRLLANLATNGSIKGMIKVVVTKHPECVEV
jgi:hypothetical protein